MIYQEIWQIRCRRAAQLIHYLLKLSLQNVDGVHAAFISSFNDKVKLKRSYFTLIAKKVYN